MSKTILITGGSGLVGTKLSEMLLAKGYNVCWLSRQSEEQGRIKVYQWNIEKGYIDKEAIKKANVVVHLAGANVGEKRWTKKYKREILESRTLSTELLFKEISKHNPEIDAFISASAIGIYGTDRGEEVLNEDSSKGVDFLAEVTKKWEASSSKFEEINIRTVLIRIGVVLSEKGGVLERMSQPIKLGTGAVLGSGRQYLSWIHIEDLCRVFIKTLEDPDLRGPYNAATSKPITNEMLTKSIAKLLNRSLVLPNVPGFILKIILGEFASNVLGGIRVSNERIVNAGFKFEFEEVEEAIKDLIAK